MLTDEEWLRSARPRTKCRTCLDEALPEVRRLLELVRRSKVPVSRRAVYDRVCEKRAGFGDRVGFPAFCKHLADHEGKAVAGGR